MSLSGPLRKVISGGQTGADQGALRAALDAGLTIGGWCPPGRICESGVIPSIFPLLETPVEHSASAPGIARSLRTEWNVRDSAGTLLWLPAGLEDPGTAWTQECAERMGRAILVCDPDKDGPVDISRWLEQHGLETLNVAGPSEGTWPGIEAQVFAVLTEVFSSSKAGGNPGPCIP